MNSSLIENQNIQAWGWKQWLVWLAVPLLVLVSVKVIVLLLGDVALESASSLDNDHVYWLLQKNWFIALNATLAGMLPPRRLV